MKTRNNIFGEYTLELEDEDYKKLISRAKKQSNTNNYLGIPVKASETTKKTPGQMTACSLHNRDLMPPKGVSGLYDFHFKRGDHIYSLYSGYSGKSKTNSKSKRHNQNLEVVEGDLQNRVYRFVANYLNYTKNTADFIHHAALRAQKDNHIWIDILGFDPEKDLYVDFIVFNDMHDYSKLNPYNPYKIIIEYCEGNLEFVQEKL